MMINAVATLSAAVAAASTPVNAPIAPSDYRISIVVPDDADRAEISGSWRFGRATAAREAVDFLLTPLAGDPKFEAHCDRRPVALVETTSTPDAGDTRWRIRLASACPSSADFSLSFSYVLDDPDAPQLRATRREGFAGGSGESWYPYASFAEREVGEISIETAASLRSVATGRQRDDRVRDGRRLSRFRTDRPAKFAFAYGDYAVTSAGKRSEVWTLSRLSGADAAALADIAEPAFDTLRKAFGPPPQGSFRIVEVDFRSLVLGASERGMIFADPSAIRNLDAGYWSHEIAHQWWGDAVRSIGGAPGASLLTEGMAEYGAHYAVDAALGAKASADRRRDNSIGRYRTLTAAGDRVALAEFKPATQDETLMAHRLATSKGALVLDLFASQYGRSRMHRVLRKFLAEHDGARTTWAEVEAALAAEGGPDARQFFEQWLHKPGAPKITLRWKMESDDLVLMVEQDVPAYRLRPDVRLSGAGWSATQRLAVDSPRARFRIPVEAPVTRIEFDPDAYVLTRAVDVAEDGAR